MKTRVFENMNDLKNNRLGGHIKNNDISFVKENNSIIIGDNNVRNSILYPPILTTVQTDSKNSMLVGEVNNNFKFTEDIILLIQQENNLEEILKYCLIGMNMSNTSTPMEAITPYKLSKNIESDNFVPDYENYYYIIPAELQQNAEGDEMCFKISKQFPYTIEMLTL